MNLDLAGKVVLVSGGSRGIGLAIAQLFAQEGSSVAISARNAQDLAQAASIVGGMCTTHARDAADPAACEKLISDVEHAWGRLDVLVTCAGSGASVAPGQETAAEWQRMMSVNLYTATNVISAATNLLASSAPASIVCISSICGWETIGAPVAYSAAKSALDMVVKGLSRPLAVRGIRINAVSPGNILFTGGTWDKKLAVNPEAVRAMLDAEVPLRCLGSPEQVASAVAFLASSRSSFTTGANLVVDGGQTRS